MSDSAAASIDDLAVDVAVDAVAAVTVVRVAARFDASPLFLGPNKNGIGKQRRN